MRGDGSSYRDTQRVKDALKIISPAPQQRADCERSVARALSSVETWREITRRTPAEQRKLLRKLAKKLREAIDLADQLNPHDLWYDPEHFNNLNISLRMRDLENLGKLAHKVAAAADRIGKKKAKGASMVRYEAVDRACTLLALYSKRPGLLSRRAVA